MNIVKEVFLTDLEKFKIKIKKGCLQKLKKYLQEYLYENLKMTDEEQQLFNDIYKRINPVGLDTFIKLPNLKNFPIGNKVPKERLVNIIKDKDDEYIIGFKSDSYLSEEESYLLEIGTTDFLLSISNRTCITDLMKDTTIKGGNYYNKYKKYKYKYLSLKKTEIIYKDKN